MPQKTHLRPFDQPPVDIGIDYALIAAGVSAALIGLIYLILI